MEPEKQLLLDERREEFCRDVSDGVRVWERLERGGWTITSLRRTGVAHHSRPWLLYLQPSETLRTRFDLAPEVLAIVNPHTKVQAREIDEVGRALASTHRLDRGLVFFFSNDPSASTELGAVLTDERRYLFASIGTLLIASDPQRWFRDQLVDRLGSMRPFAPGSPVMDAQFFGRQRELTELERRLLQTSTPVGLFGLRKVGKTSLLRRLQSQLQPLASETDPTALVLHLDVQSVNFTQRNLSGLLDRLSVEARTRCGALAGLPPATWRAAPSQRLADAELARRGSEALHDLLTWAQARQRKLIVCIDEYELLLNGQSIPTVAGLALLDHLRGLNQQYPTVFNYVVSGRNRSLANKSRFEGRQNPLFGAHHVLRLGGLDRDELGSLVRKLGRRASLDFEHRAVDRIFAESGGHPFLGRKVADLIDEHCAVARDEVVAIGEPTVVRELRGFESEVEDVMREIADAVEELEPRDGLSALKAAVDDGTGKQLEPRFVEDLVGYGIVQDAPFRPRIGVFSRWIQRNTAVTGETNGG